jgi:hypothetical protein
METTSFKALALRRLRKNQQGNQKETLSVSKESIKETCYIFPEELPFFFEPTPAESSRSHYPRPTLRDISDHHPDPQADQLYTAGAPTDWRPEPKAWLTDTGELRTQGVFDDLAKEIIRLTADNLPLQAKLLRERCGEYSGI